VPWSLVDVFRESDGKLAFEYQKFDRFVELFERAGVGERIEITHAGSFGPVGWENGDMVFSVVGATERATGKHVELPRDEGILQLFADLQRHVKKKGWLAKTMVHVADEPSIQHIAAYRRLSEAIHKAAPELRRIDAIETPDLNGALEVWVPKISHFDHWREAFDARRAGNEFWYYICCHPYGNNYPNRFLDIPSSRVRTLHWVNFAEDLTGYLHWGGNFWGNDAFGVPSKELPPGDTHVIYPGREGPLNSIRWEIERDSVEDFEYLHLLVEKTAALKKELGDKAAWIRENRRAKEFCRQVVPTISEPEIDPKRIEAVRGQIADEIIGLDQAPLFLVETEPAAGSPLVNGPVFVEVRGLVSPGAEVKVNGKPVAVTPEGRFACGAHPESAGYGVLVEAEKDGKKKTTLRQFKSVTKPLQGG
jgi:hypothetical protein